MERPKRRSANMTTDHEFAVVASTTDVQKVLNVFAEAALGPNAPAVADDQHADHPLRIDRQSVYLAVKWLQGLEKIIEVQVAVNPLSMSSKGTCSGWPPFSKWDPA
jgi:hypothetical protein